MSKTTANAYLKDGSILPVKYISSTCGNLIDFTIEIKGKEVDFLFNGDPDVKRKWLERDLKAEKKNHADGYYKEARFDFDRIEIHQIIN